MARRETRQNNELKIHDNLSDSDITLKYRMPTTKERQQYQNLSLQRHRNKVDMNTAAARLKFGMAILVDIADGDFERLDHDNYVPISSNQGSEHYYPEWRAWVEEHASDLIMLLAAQVFDASAVVISGDEIEGK